MRKYYHILTTAMLLLTLTACGTQAEVPSEQGKTPQAPEAQYSSVQELRLELQREGQDAAAVMSALRTLPEALRTALAEQGIVVEEIAVTVGASPEATAQAVAEGGVNLAFLPAAEFARLEQPPHILLARGGGQALLCAGSTEYGGNLAVRKNWTWEELDRARWAVSEEQLPALNLWLADNYRGNTAVDLSHLTVYETEEALLADAEQADLLVLTAEQEAHPCLAATERLYETVVVAGAEPALQKSGFADALAAALEMLDSDLFGQGYEAVNNAALHPMRRLMTIQGE